MMNNSDDFKRSLYEAVIFSFGKVLAKYDAFSQNMMLEDIGKEILQYLEESGFEIDYKNDDSDIMAIFDMFVKNGFTESLDFVDDKKGEKIIWHGLYGAKAYEKLQAITENPFVSCPLNACMLHEARKHDKYVKLVEKKFKLDENITETIEAIVDGYPDEVDEFSDLTLDNAKLIEIADKKESALIEANKRIRELANTDELTGIRNRRCIFNTADIICKPENDYAILMLDIDDFKNINDTYGHDIGDSVIKEVVNTCGNHLRIDDIFGRLGGEEFIIIFKSSNLKKIEEIASRMIYEISQEKISVENVSVTISIGISINSSSYRYPSFMEALKDADRAMYMSKNSGKNRYKVYDK